jgi:ABC-type ATPase involved in cell division/GNAT superfamily N-acetyltransferase
MMDVPMEQKLTRSWDLDIPLDEKEWSVGLITGASGAGKTTLARHLWPDNFYEPTWSDAALVDDFPEDTSIKTIQQALAAAGLSSVPAWLRPYGTLSVGERFRADMARALIDVQPGQIAVIDEFTSTVDRQVAKVASHALQKAVRRGGQRLVAVACHYDIIDWLQPDWIVDASVPEFNWRSVQPHPPVELEVRPCDRRLWGVFQAHHYLTGTLNSSARCFAAYHDGRPVAFASYLHFPHPRARNIKVSHRVVVLPDWQGLGIAGRISEWLGQRLHEQGYRLRAATGHPARIAYYARSPRWRMDRAKTDLASARSSKGTLSAKQSDPRRLATRRFEYVPLRRMPAPSPPGASEVPGSPGGSSRTA